METCSRERFWSGVFEIAGEPRNTYLGLLDTVFIVLRKKFRRISFLHVYERLLMVWWWFLVCRRGCGGDAYFPATVHATVLVASGRWPFRDCVHSPVTHGC